MGIKAIYERFADAIRTALGPTTYQWPYTTGYTFSRPGPSSTGGKTLLAYLALYVDPDRPGEIRVNLQPRAIAAAGQSRVEEIAKKMGGDLLKSPAGYANFWISASRNGQEALLIQLATEIVGGSQPPNDINNPGEAPNLIENPELTK
jgi:hypothetical protein